MMKPRNLVLLLIAVAAMIGPGTAVAADEPATTPTVPTTSSDPSADPATDSAPLTLSQDEIDALQDANDSSDDNKSVFEKASDFVTDNAPWFIIGIIVLAAIIAGILIMRGRPRKKKGGTPKASKSDKAMRQAGGTPGTVEQPAQVPSPSELRRRKRAAVQRSREEERARRKAGIENRKSARRGEAPVAPVAATVAGAGAVAAASVAAGGLDPVEAEKQSARDQETAAGAMARYGAVDAPLAEPPLAELPAPQAVPAPVSPSQTAPAAGVVTPYSTSTPESFDEPTLEPVAEPEPVAAYAEEPTGEQFIPTPDDTIYEPAAAPEYEAPYAAPEAETSILHESSIENPGPDATVGNAAEAFLAGGAAGAAGGLAAARASRPETPELEPPEPLEPVIAPEPGMAAEHALADPDPILPAETDLPAAEPIAGDTDTAAAEERLRAKVAEIKASQQAQPPAPAEPVAEPAAPGEPAPLGPDADLSPGLAAVERRLSENSTERDRALRDAEERLRRVEQRAEDAERRAAFAERLAQLKVEESEREKRLNDVVSGIDRAEQRAREAEQRAEAAERAAAAALEQSDLKPSSSAAQLAAEPSAPELAEPADEAAPSPEPASPEPPAPAAPAPERQGLFGGSSSASEAASDSVNLNSATFEQLREAGLSVTQATRILAYRERFGGYNSVEDLEKVPGFPTDLIESLKGKISI